MSKQLQQKQRNQHPPPPPTTTTIIQQSVLSTGVQMGIVQQPIINNGNINNTINNYFTVGCIKSIDETRFNENSVAVVKDNVLYYCNFMYNEILPNQLLPAENVKEDLTNLQNIVKIKFPMKGIVAFLCCSFGKYKNIQTYLESYGLIVVDLDHDPLPKILGYGTVSSDFYQRYGTNPSELIKKFNITKIYFSAKETSPLIPYFYCSCLPFFAQHKEKIFNLSLLYRLTVRRDKLNSNCFLFICKTPRCIGCIMYKMCIKLFVLECNCFVNMMSFHHSLKLALSKYNCPAGVHEFGDFTLNVRSVQNINKSKLLSYNPYHEADHFLPYNQQQQQQQLQYQPPQEMDQSQQQGESNQQLVHYNNDNSHEMVEQLPIFGQNVWQQQQQQQQQPYQQQQQQYLPPFWQPCHYKQQIYGQQEFWQPNQYNSQQFYYKQQRQFWPPPPPPPYNNYPQQQEQQQQQQEQFWQQPAPLPYVQYNNNHQQQQEQLLPAQHRHNFNNNNNSRRRHHHRYVPY